MQVAFDSLHLSHCSYTATATATATTAASASMAYASVISLRNTIERLPKNYLTYPYISLAPCTEEILKLAQDSVKSLQHALEKFDKIKNYSEGVKACGARIREEVCKLEDAIESQVSAQFVSQSQTHEVCPRKLFLNLDVLTQDVHCFVNTAKKLEDEYLEELSKPSDPPPAADADADSGEYECDMVGSSRFFLKIRDQLIGDYYMTNTLSYSGMAGIGKTRLAKTIFHDPLVKATFECRALVTVGRKYRSEEILQAIIAQVNLDNDSFEGDEGLMRSLKGKKCLIVLDDLWDLDFYHHIEGILREVRVGSKILAISREARIAKGATLLSSYKMPFLNGEESWDLLREKVFGDRECPPQLVKAGKKIAENCDGLPLLIITVSQHLSKAQKILEYWNAAAEKRNSVFEEACDQIYEVLLPSYIYVNQNLKPCFLYMGVFPQDYQVRHSRIVSTWHAENFLHYRTWSGDNFGGACSAFHDFVSTNLVVGRQPRVDTSHLYNKYKTYSLHVAYRHLGKREAENIKFLHVLNKYADSSIERMESQRRLAIFNNTLFAVKEVHVSIASISTLRSLLCTGPYHQYQVPICLELRLLRVLDALTIRLYEFPVEVVKLICLRYLALTCNANLPPSISKLLNLQSLIVHQHSSIKQVIQESYVPVGIWYLSGLKHLQIMGRNLPHPPPGRDLRDLAELLDVGAQSCCKEVLESVPSLTKLRIQIELAPDVAQTLGCFDHIYSLRRLKSLNAVVMNPKLLRDPIVPPLPLSISEYRLKKLSLSGFGYPWEDMSKIAKLPCLHTLKLRCYAFRGEKWDAKEKDFPVLRYLLIEDTNLVQWTIRDEAFARLRKLTMKNCHKLQEIPPISNYIELVDCNPLAETCAKQRIRARREVRAIYSWK